MGQAYRPACVQCGYENHGLPDRKQDLTQRHVMGVLVWLHLQCEFIYRQNAATQPPPTPTPNQ